MKVDPSMKNQHMDFLSNIEKMVQDGTKMGQMSPMNLGLAQHR